MSEEALTEIGELEDQRYAAMIAKDGAALERLFHDEFMMTHSNGVRDTKKSYIGGIQSGLFNYRQVDRTEQVVKSHGQVVLVSNRLAIDIIVNGEPRQLDVRALAVWLRSAGSWQLVAVQSGAAASAS